MIWTRRQAVERLYVGGWVDSPAGAEGERLLLLGERHGSLLAFVGRVRLNALQDAASRLGQGMEGLEVDRCPFRWVPKVNNGHWCRPGIAVSVEFAGRNAIGRLRSPSLASLHAQTQGVAGR